MKRSGNVYDRRNSKGIEFWLHEETGAEIKIIRGADDSRCKSMLISARREIGLSTADNKRNPQVIRDRNAAARAAAQLEVEKAKANLVRWRESDNEAEVRKAVEILEREERRFRYWDRLMRGVG